MVFQIKISGNLEPIKILINITLINHHMTLWVTSKIDHKQDQSNGDTRVIYPIPDLLLLQKIHVKRTSFSAS